MTVCLRCGSTRISGQVSIPTGQLVGGHCAACGLVWFDGKEPISEDEARMRAAAPDLMEALKDLLPHAQKAIEVLNNQMAGSLYPALNEAKIARAEKAIAKAEGTA